MKILGLALCLLWPLGGVLAADLEAVTTDGRKVILHSDRTWQYEDEISTGGEDLEKLLLSLLRVSSVGSTCNIVVRLQNSSTYPITSLVPQFSAYNEDDVVLLTLFEDFLSIKPTFHQDASISFRSVPCTKIAYVKVHGGDKCTMDDMVRMAPKEGECLKRVKVIPSGLLKFTK